MSLQLATKNLTVSIANKTICCDLNLQINPGETWGVLGQNGSGKTTLLYTLIGLHPHSQGEIWLQDKKLLSLSVKQRARQIGILFQDSQDTFSPSVLEYCLAGRYPHLTNFSRENSEDLTIAKQALADMQLENKLTQQIHTLSGGERRRLAIATLLTQAPQIYLLDEPTNHLDIHQQIHVMNHFKKLAVQNSIGIILSLHDINMAQYYCDKILLLFGNGEFLQGTPTEMLTEKNLSHVYQHPLQAISTNKKYVWIPEY